MSEESVASPENRQTSNFPLGTGRSFHLPCTSLTARMRVGIMSFDERGVRGGMGAHSRCLPSRYKGDSSPEATEGAAVGSRTGVEGGEARMVSWSLTLSTFRCWSGGAEDDLMGTTTLDLEAIALEADAGDGDCDSGGN